MNKVPAQVTIKVPAAGEQVGQNKYFALHWIRHKLGSR
jgi:hypothetical protein